MTADKTEAERNTITRPYVRYFYKIIFGYEGATWARSTTRAEADRLIEEGWTRSTKADMDWDCQRLYAQFCGHQQPMHQDAADIIRRIDDLRSSWDEEGRS